MLEEFFGELENLIWGIGIISAAIVSVLLLPRKISQQTWRTSNNIIANFYRDYASGNKNI